MRFQDGLRQAHSDLDALAALRAPLNVLSGTTAAAVAALEAIGIRTVFDLATSPLFALASQLTETAAGGGGDGLARFDSVPGGVGADGAPTRPSEFVGAGLSVLRSLSPSEASDLESSLGLMSVGDLGRWLPYRFARLALADATAGTGPGTDDARELVPRFGEFPTERHYHTTIVLDHVSVGATQDLAAAGPVDIAPTLQSDFGFAAPAVGARLTFQQSWYAHGITLGNLLHSVALGPGESTRIAVVDWSRQTTASGTEEIGESERLTNTTRHNRAISEVQEAVANEVQTGFSHAESKSTTLAAGLGGGFSMGPVSIGVSGSASRTKTSADSFSTSTGSRNLAASMSQQVADATQQAASSVRNRRASLVKEVSESEHEQVSTRILANYNHMHALTIQYYEVVEVYRVITGLHEAERCLFVPMKLTEFDERTIQHYRDALLGAALDRRAVELLTTDFGLVSLRPTVPVTLPVRPTRGFPPRVFDLAFRSRALDTMVMARRAGDPTDPTHPEEPPVVDPLPPNPPTPPTPTPTPPAPPQPFAWDLEEIRRASRVTSTNVVRAGTNDLLLPRDVSVAGAAVSQTSGGPDVVGVVARMESGRPDITFTRTSLGFSTTEAVPIDECAELLVTVAAGSGRAQGRITLELSYRGSLFPITFPLDASAGASTRVIQLGGTDFGAELIEHLRANRLHYNQALWRSLDASTVALLLSRFSFEGLPVADLIDPRPIQVAGNYLVFRMPGFVAREGLAPVDTTGTGTEALARQRWQDWLRERGLTFARDVEQEQLVPVPTGGVFAEAVLGRSNSAEKLDVTRFWNWQDSPIPLQPPEIAAISMQSRAQPIDVTPGQLGQPVLNIVNPTPLPDPAGLGAITSALQNGSMFRDMSGLASTIGLAQASGANSLSAANEAARLASANMAIAANKEVELERISAGKSTTQSSPAAMQGTPKNISETGAMLNEASKQDEAAAAPGPGGTGGMFGGVMSPDPSVLRTAARVFGPSLTGGGTGTSARDLAMRRGLFGAFGAPGAEAVLAGSPAPGGGQAPAPAQFLASRYFYGHAVRDATLDSVAEEVDALHNFQWKAASVDFRAICTRTDGREPPSNSEVSTREQFIAILEEPYWRFNFVGYFDPQLGLQLDLTASRTGTVTPDESNRPPQARSSLPIDAIVALREVAGLSTSTDSLSQRMRGTIRRNKDYRDQHPNAPLRQLALYLLYDFDSTAGNDPPTYAYAEALARAIGMRVKVLPGTIEFRPEFEPKTPTPGAVKKILLRGQIRGDWGGGTPNVRSLHDLDLDMKDFDP